MNLGDRSSCSQQLAEERFRSQPRGFSWSPQLVFPSLGWGSGRQRPTLQETLPRSLARCPVWIAPAPRRLLPSRGRTAEHGRPVALAADGGELGPAGSGEQGTLLGAGGRGFRDSGGSGAAAQAGAQPQVVAQLWR